MHRLPHLLTALTLIAFVSLTGCQPQTDAADGDADGDAASMGVAGTELPDAPPQAVSILDGRAGSAAALTQPGTMLISTADQLAELGVDELADLDVAFGSEQVVIVALGEQPTGGYWVRIDGLQQVGDTLYVQGTANRPAPDALVTQALTYPYAAVTIPAVDAELVVPDITSVTGQSLN
jgi:hypothetical protein